MYTLLVHPDEPTTISRGDASRVSNSTAPRPSYHTSTYIPKRSAQPSLVCMPSWYTACKNE
jgi:hypothetical protein